MECPPGMKEMDGKCHQDSDEMDDKKDSKDKKHEVEDNAGSVHDKGVKTTDSPNNRDIPGTDNVCPEGSTWNADKGICEATGDSAGKIGGAGTGDPDVPGKEAIMLERILNRFSKAAEKTAAAHTEYNQKLMENNMVLHQKSLEAFSNRFGVGGPVTKESASFGHMRAEASSMVDSSGYNSVRMETVETPAKFLFDLKKGSTKESFWSWDINPESYLKSLLRVKSEGFTITGGDMPQIFSKQVYLIPGGRMKVPIRQFLDTQILEDADRFNWYKVNGFDFDDTSSEGTQPTTEPQTITKIQALPTITRALQIVNYADIENAPFDLIEAFNRAAALGALSAESKEVLTSTYNALASTPNSLNTFQWVRGDTGADITTDDVSGLGALKVTGIYAAKKAIDNKGGDSSPGNIVAFLSPQAVQDLIEDAGSEFWTGSPPIGAPLHSTSLGILENRLGIDIVMNNQVAFNDGSNVDADRNILCVKGSLGLAVAADIQIEAQRRPDLSSIYVGARHRIKGAIIDETMTVRISTLAG